MKTAQRITTENPELNDRFNRVLGETVEALEEAGIRYVFIGGIASGGLGRPRSTHDIDVFVRPEEAELSLRALARKGFRTERTDPVWLYKAFKESILVDVIFKSKGEIYLDSEMLARATSAEFHGRQLRLVAPEDLIIIKALAHSEVTPNHWHDALALLTHATIDWDYLIKRATRAPRRVLSLLLYAQSIDVGVPKQAIDRFYHAIFGDHPPANPATEPVPKMPSTSSRPGLRVFPSHSPAAGKGAVRVSIARLREQLAEDPRTNELDIEIEHWEGKILLRGEVNSVERRDAAEQVARETFPECAVENQLRVTNFPEPSETEAVR